MCEVEEGINVREKLITDVHGCLGSLDDGGPDVGFLIVCCEGVVVAVEREESCTGSVLNTFATDDRNHRYEKVTRT